MKIGVMIFWRVGWRDELDIFAEVEEKADGCHFVRFEFDAVGDELAMFHGVYLITKGVRLPSTRGKNGCRRGRVRGFMGVRGVFW